MKFRPAITPVFLMLCLLLGGASAAGFLANVFLELLAVGLLFLALLIPKQSPPSASSRHLLILLGIYVALFAIQLIPLPPLLWAHLPGRQLLANDYALLDQPLPWLALSLAPDHTISSLLWMLPAVATLLQMLIAGNYRGDWLAWGIIAVAALSILVGAIQMSSGESSPFYFYEITNRTSAVGFFANSNHLATLLLATVPFVAALQATAVSNRQRRSFQSSSGVIILSIGMYAAVAVGLLINTSIAGWGLSVPVAIASVLLVRYRLSIVPRWAGPALIILIVIAVAVVLVAPLGNNLTSGNAKQSSESRATSFAVTAQAAKDFLPVGSGIGTFQEIYRSYESPLTITGTYLNHAHSDLLEIWLETGLFGLGILIAFVTWWWRRLISIWTDVEHPDHFARAATIASAAILAHSTVDYPLRTAAISTLFVICLALMAEPSPWVRPRRTGKSARHLSAN